ncbi:hypothetical protein N7517_004471 [Penicillium concentricum]|uniref:Uncharacterized protein n=1 Tax=Penicillium concentricum TaxID=293559 RepID=A0A9W9S6W6_9EURO|nr:uncharacterized protein N7517_004471 [Penicillium concentricum]KAJ5372465.1 hypothetical protein N7517_004471 [Penicillium concentricum]
MTVSLVARPLAVKVPWISISETRQRIRSDMAVSLVAALSSVKAPWISISETHQRMQLPTTAFGSQSALEQHIQYSRAHIAAPRTPLDMFFQSFTGFMYNQALPPSDSYTQLKRFRRWGDNDPEDKRAWKQYQSALELEVKMWFGAEDDLGAWHSLCRAIGIEPLPVTCGQAVKVGNYLESVISRVYAGLQLEDWKSVL